MSRVPGRSWSPVRSHVAVGVVTALASVAGAGWASHSVLSSATILQIGGVALLVGGSFGALVGASRSRWLREVTERARRLGGGEVSIRFPAGGPAEQGTLAAALDVVADQLERRRTELQAERTEARTLLDAISESVLVWEPDGSVRHANPAARRTFGLGVRAEGLPPEAVSRRPEFLSLVASLLRGEPIPEPVGLELHGRHLLARGEPLPEGGGVLVLLDVSEIRRLEDARRDFVANASHELKTPLTAIRGFSETLLDPQLPDALRDQFARTVHSNAERLQRIVDDLLDLSRIESGGWVLTPEPVHLETAALDAWGACCEGSPDAALVCFDTEAEDVCEWVDADPVALHQIFVNLFSNARRYTPTGGTIAVAAAPVPGSDQSVRIEVRDTGSGIPSAHLPRVFERFYRVDPSRSRAEGGTGLGLSIVRHLVERHGGTVGVTSELGRGTTVHFTLPQASVQPG